MVKNSNVIVIYNLKKPKYLLDRIDGKITFAHAVQKLKETLDEAIKAKEEVIIHPEVATKYISEAIEVIATELRVHYLRIQDVIKEIIGRFDYFASIGELEKLKEKEELKLAIIDLIAYILFAQILFYYIYSKRTGKLPVLKEIKSLDELEELFKKIKEINYRTIYGINIVKYLKPIEKKVIDAINKTIGVIYSLSPEKIRYELFGRVYQKAIPWVTRKILAAFYTHPIAAEILAGLTIDRWDETILDPACGSGTLLASAYLWKMQDARRKGLYNVDELHKRFITKDITGLDIMPFAAFLTAINLSSLNFAATTDFLRISQVDSLDISKKLYEIREKGYIEIKSIRDELINFLKGTIQTNLVEFLNKKDNKKEIPELETFKLYPVDIIIMNPPFTDREKLPEDYRKKLNELESLNKICGKQINLWGYFLALAHYLLKENGKIGAVVPINIARGKATEKIRKIFLKNYHIRWIVKPTADIAFSEGAAFRDILFIVEKRKPKEGDITGIVFIKKSIRSPEFTIEEAGRIVNDLRILYEKAKEGKVKHYKDPDGFYEVYFVDYKTLRRYEDNLMPLLKETGLEGDLMEIILERAKDKLRKLQKEELKEGFHASPQGVSELVYITRPLDKSRIERNVVMILHSEDEVFIYVVFKDKIKDLLRELKDGNLEEFIRNNIKPDLKIPKDCVLPGLRTITGIRTINITNKHDYIVVKDFDGFKEVVLRSKWKDKSLAKDSNKRREFWTNQYNKAKKRQAFLAIQHRINLISPNTSVITTFLDKKFVPPHAFNIFITDSEIFAEINDLHINSVIYIYQLSKLIKETTGTYAEFMKKDLLQTYILDINKLSHQEKQLLLNLFEEIKDIEFPCIMEQMKKGLEYMKQCKDKSWDDIFKELKQNDLGIYARIKLDYTILKVLGFSDDEIKDLLEKAYEVVYKELGAMKKAR